MTASKEDIQEKSAMEDNGSDSLATATAQPVEKKEGTRWGTMVDVRVGKGQGEARSSDRMRDGT